MMYANFRQCIHIKYFAVAFSGIEIIFTENIFTIFIFIYIY